MKFLEYLTEAESGVKSQLMAIKNGSGEWEQHLKAMITGKEPVFTFSGPKNFQTTTPVEIPGDIKRKYPDVVFALQALSLHLGSNRYYDKWEEAKKYLTFKPKLEQKTFYRYWPTTEEQLQDLRNGKSIKLKEPKATTTSYTKHPSMWREVPSFTTLDPHGKSKVLAISTEHLLQTHGSGLTLQTKHTFTPVFDVFYFVVHLLNQVKQVFGKEAIEFEKSGLTTLRSFTHEREVIGPIITEIKPLDVVGYYKNSTFNKLTDKEYKIDGYTFLPNDIEKLKNSYKKNKIIDMTWFGNHLIITTEPEKSNLKRYAIKGLNLSQELSKLVGTKIYLGYWP